MQCFLGKKDLFIRLKNVDNIFAIRSVEAGGPAHIIVP
jgi:hypothetical protein